MPQITKCSAISEYRELQNNVISITYDFMLVKNAEIGLGGIARISQLQILQVFFTLGFSALLLSEIIGTNVAGFGLAVSQTD